MTRAIPLLLALFLIPGCSKEDPPAGVLDRGKFIEAYTALVNNERKKSNWTVYNIRKYHPDSTLAALGVTREEMIATVEFYSDRSEWWQGFYVDAVRSLQQEKSPPSDLP